MLQSGQIINTHAKFFVQFVDKLQTSHFFIYTETMTKLVSVHDEDRYDIDSFTEDQLTKKRNFAQSVVEATFHIAV